MAQQPQSNRVAQLFLMAVLASAAVATGLGIVAAKHEARQLFAELEELNREQDRLQIDWGRWQLEQSAYATHSLIESIARERLRMLVPESEQLLIVAESAQ